jgi:hypothetical protein
LDRTSITSQLHQEYGFLVDIKDLLFGNASFL